MREHQHAYAVSFWACCALAAAAAAVVGEAGGCWQGAHTEGIVWHTLFGLLMWPVLFAPVPEVFR